MRYFSLILSLWLAPNVIFGQSHVMSLEEGTSSPKATIEQVAWIAGQWKGEAFGGQTEEIWSRPSTGSMMGSFKLSEGDEIVFYELCLFREVNQTVLFQLKHFNADLTGWEEKNETVDFPLVKMTKDAAYFDGITFERISKDELHVYVNIEEDGKVREVPFIYKRETR